MRKIPFILLLLLFSCGETKDIDTQHTYEYMKNINPYRSVQEFWIVREMKMDSITSDTYFGEAREANRQKITLVPDLYASIYQHKYLIEQVRNKNTTFSMWCNDELLKNNRERKVNVKLQRVAESDSVNGSANNKQAFFIQE